MDIYRLDFALNDYARLQPVDENDIDRFAPLDGTPMAASWRPVRVAWETEDGAYPRCDVTEVSGAPVFNARAVEALSDLLEGRGELLPLDVEGGDQHYAFNVTRLSGALDEGRSECEYFSDGRILGVDRHEFDPVALAGETIFKLIQKRNYEYVVDALRERAEGAGLTGFRWREPVWSAPRATKRA